MTTLALKWTQPALAGLERYFAVRLSPGQLDGADPDELRADLQSHFEEELVTAGVTVVTEEDLRLVLGRMGETLPAAPLSRKPAPVKPTAPPIPPPVKTVPWPIGVLRWPKCFLAFAVVLPLITFVFEVLTRGGSGTLFDPMPDVWHHLLVLSVPLAGWWFWRTRRPENAVEMPRWVPALTGFGLGVSLFYALCFAPVAPFAILGIVFGVGVFPLVPIMAAVVLWRAKVLLLKDRATLYRRPLRLGFWIGFLTILALQVPGILTYTGIQKAGGAGANGKAWAEATVFLRRFGSEAVLLKACYSGESNTDPAGWMISPFVRKSNRWTSPWNDDSTVARDLYYRVTGVPFNEKPSPLRNSPLVRNDFNRSRSWSTDMDRGGTRVAGRIEGLSLAEGRMDWHCEQASGLTWGEWTLTFDNQTGAAEEARCRIALPPGGFVSRVTLWVNGKPEEAAYSTVGKVRAAYQSVAVVQRRDPVLVTQPDAGSILVQAFPVPAHGQLKTRITFTVPAGVDQKVWLPSIVERNFDFPDDAQLPLWVQADKGTLTLPAEARPHAATEGGSPTVSGHLPGRLFTGGGTWFTWAHQPAPLIYTTDPFGKPEAKQVVRQSAPPTIFQPSAIAWVVDASAPVAPQREVIEAALRGFAPGTPAAIFIPGDHPGDTQTLTDAAAVKLSFAGGRDNGPALVAAVDWLRGKTGACLIWLHGPQPSGIASRVQLEQMLERSVAPFTLVDVPLAAGENRLGPIFANHPRINLLPVRHAGESLSDSLRSAFQQPAGTFTVLPDSAAPPEGAVKTSDALARWFARTEAARLALTNPAAASALAASHQIVSPWSGAVVLERSSDYAQHGLEQSNASSSQQVPVVPEPFGVLLLLLSASHFLLRRRRQRA